MVVTVSGGGSCVKVRIAGYHTNIVLIEKDGEVLYKVGAVAAREAQMADRSLLNVEDIYDFAKTADLEDVRSVIRRQIAYNSAISEASQNDWGANGSVLLKAYGDDIRVRAGCGCSRIGRPYERIASFPLLSIPEAGIKCDRLLPVIGMRRTGLQRGRTLPRPGALEFNHDHQKTGIGRLSAYCGAVSADAGPDRNRLPAGGRL